MMSIKTLQSKEKGVQIKLKKTFNYIELQLFIFLKKN